MTRSSVREYIGAIRERYVGAGRRAKGKILDEATRVTGYHRKALIRLLRPGNGRGPARRRGRPRRYGPVEAEALKVAWEATDRLCSKRLQPFISELVPILRRHGARCFTDEVEAQLRQMSATTMDRLLKPYRRTGGRRAFSTTKPGSLLKASIPIRTFADWHEDQPGYLEMDLVAHCSRVPGSGVIRGRGSGERETTASSLAGKEESSRKEENSGQGKDGPAGAIAQGGNGR